MPITTNEIRVMIVDDHKMFLEGIISLLKDYPHIDIADYAKDGVEALGMIRKDPELDVLITDISMPNLSGEELCKIVKREFPHIHILALSMHSDGKSIQRILRNGATGYILKNTGQEELIEAIEMVANGKTYFSEKVKNNIMAFMTGTESSEERNIIKLTKREIEILKCIASELTTNEIAEKLFISLHTVESHRKNIMRKTKAKNMAGLIKYALKNGIIE